MHDCEHEKMESLDVKHFRCIKCKEVYDIDSAVKFVNRYAALETLVAEYMREELGVQLQVTFINHHPVKVSHICLKEEVDE